MYVIAGFLIRQWEDLCRRAGVGMEECGENPQVPRTAMANECKMKKQIEDRDMLPELPTGSHSQLLNYINEVSFCRL